MFCFFHHQNLDNDTKYHAPCFLFNIFLLETLVAGLCFVTLELRSRVLLERATVWIY